MLSSVVLVTSSFDDDNNEDERWLGRVPLGLDGIDALKGADTEGMKEDGGGGGCCGNAVGEALSVAPSANGNGDERPVAV